MSDAYPKISVVVCAYNEEKYIRDCLVSVKKQVADVPFEIIVVNNASTDETAQIAKDENVIVANQPEKGVGHARAKGLEVARGELLVYLDADTRLPQGWLQNVYDYFQAHPKVAAVTTDFRFYDGRLTEVVGQRFFNALLMPINNMVMSIIGKPEVLIGQSAALRTDWLRKAGGINLDFPFHGEDTSLAYRMHTQGKVKFVNDFYVYSSARRYQREGLFRTLFAYWTTYWYLTLGGYERAVKFAHRHNPKHLKSTS